MKFPTTKEIIARDFAQPILCPGVRLIPGDGAADSPIGMAIRKRDALVKAGDVAKLKGYFEELTTALAPRGHKRRFEHPADATLKEYRRALIQLVNARGGCGADNAEIIRSQPMDGELHEHKCSKCGNVFAWRPACSAEEASKHADRMAAKLAKAIA